MIAESLTRCSTDHHREPGYKIYRRGPYSWTIVYGVRADVGTGEPFGNEPLPEPKVYRNSETSSELRLDLDETAEKKRRDREASRAAIAGPPPMYFAAPELPVLVFEPAARFPGRQRSWTGKNYRRT